MSINERERIKDYNKGELPQGGYLMFYAQTEFPSRKIELIKDVVAAISEFDASNWPNDNVWDLRLPSWFLKEIKKHSVEEITQDKSLWEYGSWLDAMKYRGWEWYSSLIDHATLRLILEPHSLPFIVDPLQYVISAAGIEYDSIKFEDHSSLAWR